MNAIDMSQFIAPKSDQLNSDDLIGGPRTVTITRVTGNEGNAEQPVNVFFEGDEGKPFRPCKSMRRVMVKIWGANAANYVGKSMTLYRDPKVKWGGMEVGGIRISHMTGIDKPEVMALTETRSARKPYTVQPLKDVPATANGNGQAKRQTPAEWAEQHREAVLKADSIAALDALIAKGARAMEKLAEAEPTLHEKIGQAYLIRRSELEPSFASDADATNDDALFDEPAEAAE